MFECQLVMSIKKEIISWFGIRILQKIIEDLLQMTNLGWHTKLKYMTLAAWSHAVPHIWLARNEKQFNNSTCRVRSIVATILENIKMRFSLSKGWIPYKIELDILDIFQIKGRYRRARRIIAIIWKNPNWGWMKINTDGS